ncbi:MAG: acetyltransferase [Frankiales bacterium]|nr:acetyltransferase [Frankiales bacterium]
MTLQVRLAGPQDMPAVFALRHEVFVVGQGVPVALERDDLDAAADHAVAFRDGVLVGTGRLLDGRTDEEGRLVPGTSGSVATIGRMAVAASERGLGTGRAVLDALVARATERGLPAVELHAQVHARAFYERAGFRSVGEVYLEAGIEHVGMLRQQRP